MGEAKRRAADLAKWQAALTPQERKAVDVAAAAHEHIIARFGATGMCYRMAFFLTEFLEAEHGISAEPVVGYVNDGGDAFMSSHAWVELNGKRIDVSLTRLEQPSLPSGDLLILDRVFQSGQARYSYHRQRDRAALDLLDRYARSDPSIAEDIRLKEDEHRRMADLAEAPDQRRAYLDGAPDGMSYGAMSALVGGKGFDFSRVLAACRTPDEADAYRTYAASDADLDALQEVGKRVLTVFPDVAGACALMTALYAVGLDSVDSGPCYVVAGDLSVPEGRVFGDGGDNDLSGVFNASDPSWDGHCWIVLGKWIADVSICRTVKSGRAPPALTRHMRDGLGRAGLLIHSDAAAAEAGLFYRPRYILTKDQIDGLARGAMATLGA
jgi:hypothetical protein